MSINTTKAWTMPEWMVKYSKMIGGKEYGTREKIEEIFNSDKSHYLLIRTRIVAKIEMLQLLESKHLI